MLPNVYPLLVLLLVSVRHSSCSWIVLLDCSNIVRRLGPHDYVMLPSALAPPPPPPTFTMLPTITFGKKYYRNSKKAKQAISKPSSNTEEQAASNAEITPSITLKNRSHFHDLLTAELQDYADLIKYLNMTSFHKFCRSLTNCQDTFYDLNGSFSN